MKTSGLFFASFMLLFGISSVAFGQNMENAAPVLPPQITAWQADSQVAMAFPGPSVTIAGNVIDFSSAGRFTLAYAGTYAATSGEGGGDGQVFRVVSAITPKPEDKNLLCSAPVTFIVLTARDDGGPYLQFDLFSDKTPPDPHADDGNGTSCASFAFSKP